MQQILEALDLGILVTSVRFERVYFRNPLGATILARFAEQPEQIPKAIGDALRASANPAHPESRFSRASKVSSPDGRDFYVRSCLLLSPTPRRLVTIAPAVVRSMDIQEILQQRYGLTLRQAKVSAMLRTGLQNQEIARQLNLSIYTVKRYVSEAMLTLGLKRRAELSAFVERLCAPQDKPTS